MERRVRAASAQALTPSAIEEGARLGLRGCLARISLPGFGGTALVPFRGPGIGKKVWKVTAFPGTLQCFHSGEAPLAETGVASKEVQGVQTQYLGVWLPTQADERRLQRS